MATIHNKTDIDLNKNQIYNHRLHNTAVTPSSPVVGQIIYNTTLNEPLVWNGSVWKSLFSYLPLSGGTLTGPLILNGPLTLNDIGTTTPVNNLGVDANGNVVIGDSSITITPITYIDLMSLKTSKSLVPGVRYFITDRDIWIDALDIDKLAMECKRHFRIVKDEFYTPHIVSGSRTNNYLGIYGQTIQRGSVPNTSGIGGTIYFAIWGGRMWQRNTSSSDVPGNSNETIAGGWTLLSTTNDTYYESKIFDIKYDFANDLIWEQSDDRGNKIKRSSNSTSYIDITDWGNSNIYNNENFGIFNNFRATTKATIYGNSNYGPIYNNSSSGVITNNSNNGYIRDNSNSGNITNNSNNGYIWDNSNNGVISDNSNMGYIRSNSSSEFSSFNMRYNRNNGHIRYNRAISNITMQYNINNGNIGTTSITDRSSSISDSQVHK